MKIGVRNQEQLVIRVVRDLLREDFPVNYNLVVPPGFGEVHLRRQLAEELRSVAGPEGALVAEITPDRFEDAAGYVSELQRQWGIGEPLPTGLPPNAMLAKLLEWIPRDQPAIQLISRFHKIVDCLGRWVLAALRTYEQDHRLRSINLTPLPYSALIRLWEEQTRSVFTVSNYGDGHATEVVEPLPAVGLVERSVAEGLPPGLARFATELTGGYPEPFEVVVAEWHRLNRPELRPETRTRLRSVAVSRLARFAKYLDFGTGSIYRDHVLHLYHAVDTEVALLALGHHPWSSILIEDDRLRAEGLGQAVHDAAIGEVIRAGQIQQAWHTVFDRAVEMYHRRQFASVLRLLDASIGSSNRIEHQLLRHHASIMDCLYRNEGKAQGSGAGWAAIIPAIANAAATLKVYQVQIPHADLIGARYGDLDQVARIIADVAAPNVPKNRIIDTLAGLKKERGTDPRTTALLLAADFEAYNAIPGDSEACRAAVALPEQLFRVWAFWRLGLNYYAAPPDDPDVRVTAADAWVGRNRNRGEMRNAEPGKEFPSFPGFAYYCVAMMQQHRNDALITAPVADYQALDRALSAYEVRNDFAHAVTLIRKRERTQFFGIIDKWLDCVIASCPTPSTRGELMAIVEPLPILDHRGDLG